MRYFIAKNVYLAHFIKCKNQEHTLVVLGKLTSNSGLLFHHSVRWKKGNKKKLPHFNYMQKLLPVPVIMSVFHKECTPVFLQPSNTCRCIMHARTVRYEGRDQTHLSGSVQTDCFRKVSVFLPAAGSVCVLW